MIHKVFVDGKPYLLDDSDGAMISPVMGAQQWGENLPPGPWHPDIVAEAGIGGWTPPGGLPPLPASYGTGVGGGYTPPFQQTQAGMELGGQQAMQQLGLQGQQTQEQLATQHAQALAMAGVSGQQAQEILATQFGQATAMAAIQQQYGLETLGIQGQQQMQLQGLVGEQQMGLQGLVGGQQMEQLQAGIQRDFRLQDMQTQASQELERLRQKGQLTLEEMKQKFALEQQLKQLAFEREALFVQYKGSDPVRAVMMGMGMLGEGQQGGQYGGLPQVRGAAQFEQQTEQALGGLLGGRQIDITAEGVGGLGTAEKAATAFQRGGAGEKTLLTSAHGVGHESLGGGLSSEEFTRRIQDVTPTGVL